jgi:hypothetical protein
MLTIEAYNKRKNLFFDFRLYLFLIFGIGAVILSYSIYQNIIIALTLTIALVSGLIVFAMPKKKIDIVLTGEDILIEDYLIPLEDCVFWSLVDLRDDLELVIQTTNLSNPFIYVYLKEDTNNLKDFVAEMTQMIPYNEEIAYLDNTHNLLRTIGLK